MENNGASCSLAPNNYHSPQQSQWLQVTLSDLNKKMKAMKTLLEEDGDSSARQEIYCNRRLELFQMLEELNNSYHSLAEKYDQLRSKLYLVTHSVPPSYSNTDNKTRLVGSSSNSPLELFDSCLHSILREPDVDCANSNFDFEYLNKLVAELMSTEQHNMKMKMKLDIGENHCNKKATDLCNKKGIHMMMDNNFIQDQATYGDLSESSYKQANTWSELKFQVTKLMEENLKQQAELARRNIEKRVVINKLRLQLEHLKDENRALQSCINCLNLGEKCNQLQISKLRRLFSGKLFGLGCS